MENHWDTCSTCQTQCDDDNGHVCDDCGQDFCNACGVLDPVNDTHLCADDANARGYQPGIYR